jgi:hypothetical protein
VRANVASASCDVVGRARMGFKMDRLCSGTLWDCFSSHEPSICVHLDGRRKVSRRSRRWRRTLRMNGG